MFFRPQHLHFTGIGGIGMSGIAEVLLTLGYQISGSDQKKSRSWEPIDRPSMPRTPDAGHTGRSTTFGPRPAIIAAGPAGEQSPPGRPCAPPGRSSQVHREILPGVGHPLAGIEPMRAGPLIARFQREPVAAPRAGQLDGPREQGRYAAEFYTTVKTAYTLA